MVALGLDRSYKLKLTDWKRVYCVLLFPHSALALSVKAPEVEYIPPVIAKKSLCGSQAKTQTFTFFPSQLQHNLPGWERKHSEI